MTNDFNNYTHRMKAGVQQIPEHNVLFWGGWFCQRLFDTYGDCISRFFSKDVFSDIENIIAFVWKVVDNREANKRSRVQELLATLSNIDETVLDQLAEDQDAVYELILSLDAMLNGLRNDDSAWAYNVSQSTINVIDKILQNDGIDITTDKGFNNDLCLKEVDTQFTMLEWLRHHTGTSKDNRLFRYYL